MSGSEIGVRAVTDEEVAHLRDHGWVKLPQLLSPALAGRLLARAQVHMGPGGARDEARHGTDTGNVFWNDRHGVAEDDEAFAAVCLGRGVGGDAPRLMRRPGGGREAGHMLA